MYSVSQLNEDKYRVLSDTLTEAFNVTERSLNPIQIGEPVKALNPGMFEDVVESPESLPGTGDAELQSEAAKPLANNAQADGGEQATEDASAVTYEKLMPEEFIRISEALQREFADLITEGLLSVNNNEEWLEIELKSSLLFPSAEAELSVIGDEVIIEISKLLSSSELPIRVEGFTDDRPMSSSRFPSNWELSAARASSVVKLLAEEGIAPTRLAAIGYGEFQPVASNQSPQGRAANRRVSLLLSRYANLRPQVVRRHQVEVEQSETTDVSGARPGEVEETPTSGVVRLQLDDGRVLFTSDPERIRTLQEQGATVSP